MANAPRGQLYGNARDGFRTRITLGKGRPYIPLPLCKTERQARARMKLLAHHAQRLTQAGLGDDAPTRQLVDRIGASVEAQLPRLLSVVDALIGGQLKRSPEAAARAITFGDVAMDWANGVLAEQHPTRIKAIKHTHTEGRIRRLGEVMVRGRPFTELPIAQVTLDDADQALDALARSGLSMTTVGHYARLIGRVMSLAWYPCRLISGNPIPPRFAPRASTKRYPYLYPSEDAQLLGCPEVPLQYRLLYGFAARNGMRPDELRRLDWDDVDLVRGIVSLRENKTDDPRAWALADDVVRALKPHQQPDGPVFRRDDGVRLPDKNHAAELFRAHLETAGVERMELFEAPDDGHGVIRLHDLRATFVTVSLANERTESWVADRTGHRSSAMINRYRRQARAHAEARLGPLGDMADLLLGKSTPPGMEPTG